MVIQILFEKDLHLHFFMCDCIIQGFFVTKSLFAKNVASAKVLFVCYKIYLKNTAKL